MTIKVRRVITGHDASGRAVVKIDESLEERHLEPPRRVGLRGLDHRRDSRRTTPATPTPA